MAEQTLENALEDYGRAAYLITVGDNGPHTSSVTVELSGDTVRCALGKSAQKNIGARPDVSLLWPPREIGGYSIIVNGKAVITGSAVGGANADIAVSKSVFHRPGTKSAAGVDQCQSDCVALKRS